MYPVIGSWLDKFDKFNYKSNRRTKSSTNRQKCRQEQLRKWRGFIRPIIERKKEKTNATTAIVTRLSKVIPVCVGFDFLR